MPPLPERLLGALWRSFFVKVSLIVVVAVSVLFAGIVAHGRKAMDVELDTRARTLFGSIVLAREWNAAYGGVYVERTPDIQRNPYVKVPDVVARDGKSYTSKNHALMTREISEIVSGAAAVG